MGKRDVAAEAEVLLARVDAALGDDPWLEDHADDEQVESFRIDPRTPMIWYRAEVLKLDLSVVNAGAVFRWGIAHVRHARDLDGSDPEGAEEHRQRARLAFRDVLCGEASVELVAAESDLGGDSFGWFGCEDVVDYEAECARYGFEIGNLGVQSRPIRAASGPHLVARPIGTRVRRPRGRSRRSRRARSPGRPSADDDPDPVARSGGRR